MSYCALDLQHLELQPIFQLLIPSGFFSVRVLFRFGFTFIALHNSFPFL